MLPYKKPEPLFRLFLLEEFKPRGERGRIHSPFLSFLPSSVFDSFNFERAYFVVVIRHQSFLP